MECSGERAGARQVGARKARDYTSLKAGPRIRPGCPATPPTAKTQGPPDGAA